MILERIKIIIPEITFHIENVKITYINYSENPLILHVNLLNDHFLLSIWYLTSEKVYSAYLGLFFVFLPVIIYKYLKIPRICFMIFRQITHFLIQ